LLALEFGDGFVGLLFPLVAEALKEHQREDVVLVVLASCLASEDVGRAPEVGFKLLLREFHRRHEGLPRLPEGLRKATLSSNRIVS